MLDKIFTPEVINALVSLIAMILISVITVVSVRIKVYFMKYLETVKSEKLRNVVSTAYDHLGKVVEDAVLYTKQILTDDLKKEGKLDQDSVEKALTMAKNYVFSNVSLEMLNVLHSEFGDLDDLISALIEAKLGKVKNEK
jgi:hypothetical protein